MFFELTEEQKEIKQRARDYAEKRISVVQEEDYDKGVFRPEIVKEMGELGFFAGQEGLSHTCCKRWHNR